MLKKRLRSVPIVLLLGATALIQVAVAEPKRPTSDAPAEWAAPVIPQYGKVREYPDAAAQLKPNQTYKVVFNVTKAAQEDGEVVPGLERAARFLNLAGLAKVPSKNLHLVAVLHGPATSAVLSEKAYQSRFNGKNPNLELISALKEAGVEVMVCGQALAHKKFEPSEVTNDVTVAVAALTVLAQYQMDGYALIPN